jgi:hypothetical protein
MQRITLSELALEKRVPLRPAELMQHDFYQQFDDETFAYDVFSRGGRTYFICPPLDLGLWERASKAIFADGKLLEAFPIRIYHNKITKVIIDKQIDMLNICGRSLMPTQIESSTANRKKILYTLQKDNSVKWIADWIDWHASVHEIDTVIIYDNSSEMYAISKLQDLIVPSGVELIVRACPYKYGPSAHLDSSWDSDFLQYAMLEHMRYFYCCKESLLINSDIDDSYPGIQHNPKLYPYIETLLFLKNYATGK